ncbi:hypothetical protein C8R47DRAFT_1083724 [Mycena vitilis]|nr:hypothetical protein C8R47DRAFT_1083724 [Mycena vitilis]
MPDGRINVNSNTMGHTIRALVKQDGADPHAPETIRKAREIAGPAKKSDISRPDFGFVAQWVSEVGDAATLEGLLSHADTFLNPTWENGGWIALAGTPARVQRADARDDICSYAMRCVETLSIRQLPWSFMGDEAVRNFALKDNTRSEPPSSRFNTRPV